MARTLPTLAGLAGLAYLAALPAPAAAQTAGDINRLNAAIQICNSPMGAGMAECAKLRGQLGMGRAQGLGGLGAGGGGGGGTSGALLGALGAAMSARQAPAPVAPAATAANRQMIADCVRAAAGNTAAIQACLNTASAPRVATAAPLPSVPRLGEPLMAQPLLPQPGMGQNAAVGIHQAGQSYQACAAANPSNWQSCLPLLNGGQAR